MFAWRRMCYPFSGKRPSAATHPLLHDCVIMLMSSLSEGCTVSVAYEYIPSNGT